MKRDWFCIALLILVFNLAGCSKTYPERSPQGEMFPTVTGNTLDGIAVTLPDDLDGQPTVLLIGYLQESQFDIDRWLLGLLDSGTVIAIYEIPTIPGMIPGWFSTRIDEGMRSGIPSEDWASVITVYDDGEKIAALTGNENGLPARVMLLDSKGIIRFFHDRGYSVSSLKNLLQAIDDL